ncbi:MAG: COG2426 family protein, partial [bacterium]
LLKFIQRKINKYIVSQLNPDFEFIFVGMNGLTVKEELEMDIKKASIAILLGVLLATTIISILSYGLLSAI